MATIKAYTDIEQSKKLAEILPTESADMIWSLTNPDLPIIMAIPYEDSDYSNKHLNIIAAWSLIALLEVMPQKIFDGEFVINITEGCDNKWVLTYDYYENRNYYRLFSGADNLIDACVEMIEKLHELELI